MAAPVGVAALTAPIEKAATAALMVVMAALAVIPPATHQEEAPAAPGKARPREHSVLPLGNFSAVAVLVLALLAGLGRVVMAAAEVRSAARTAETARLTPAAVVAAHTRHTKAAMAAPVL